MSDTSPSREAAEVAIRAGSMHHSRIAASRAVTAELEYQIAEIRKQAAAVNDTSCGYPGQSGSPQYGDPRGGTSGVPPWPCVPRQG